jgi:hypothetical protein
MLLVYPWFDNAILVTSSPQPLATWEFGPAGLQFRDDSYMYVGAESILHLEILGMLIKTRTPGKRSRSADIG